MYGIQTAAIDDKDIQFTYLDSGAVEGNTYTTLVVVHGHTYHAQTFKKLLPLAPKHNLRVVAMNRRDYAGSSLYTPEELHVLDSEGSDAHEGFLRDRGSEIARFMAWFIRRHDIPKASEDGKGGGMALLGWSAGNITTLAFLANVDSYTEEVIQTLEPYLTTQIVFDTAYTAMGYSIPEGGYHPLLDLSIPEDARAAVFYDWVSSYFTHPNLSVKNISGLQLRIPHSPRQPPTNSNIHPSEFESITDPEAAKRSENQFLRNVKSETLHEQMRCAVFDEEMAGRFLRGVKVRIVYCKETIWSIMWGKWKLEEEIERMSEDGVRGRDISITLVEPGNHFLHWDEPDRALAVFSALIRQTATLS